MELLDRHFEWHQVSMDFHAKAAFHDNEIDIDIDIAISFATSRLQQQHCNQFFLI